MKTNTVLAMPNIADVTEKAESVTDIAAASSTPLSIPSEHPRVAMNSKAENGFTVCYTGKKFSPDHHNHPAGMDNPPSGLLKLRANFGEMGGLGMHFHLGQGQRAGLLSQITRYDYEKSPVE